MPCDISNPRRQAGPGAQSVPFLVKMSTGCVVDRGCSLQREAWTSLSSAHTLGVMQLTLQVGCWRLGPQPVPLGSGPQARSGCPGSTHSDFPAKLSLEVRTHPAPPPPKFTHCPPPNSVLSPVTQQLFQGPGSLQRPARPSTHETW